MIRLRLLVLVLLTASGVFAQAPNTLTPSDKLYGLSKFWEEVNYNFVYLDKVDRQLWDSTYRSLLGTITGTRNDYEYFREMQRFCALLHDGHTNVFVSPAVDSMVLNTMFGPYRIFLTNIGGKAIVERTNVSKKDEIPVGTEVIRVNGMETREYIRRFVAPYISSSTDYVLQDIAISKLLQGLAGERFDVAFRLPSGTVRELTLVHAKTAEEETSPALPREEIFNLKWYDNKIAYLKINTFGNPKVDTLFIQKLPELSSARALILDLRDNGGGSTGIGAAILQYLTRDTILYGSRIASRMHIPAYKAWGRWVNPSDTSKSEWARKSLLSYYDKMYYNFDYSPDTVRLEAPRLVVPTVLLIGHNTASAAEDFLILADRQKHMTKIGERSFGSTGQPMIFDLPGGGSARVCTKKDTYPDGREFVGVGVAPDIAVTPTLDDYLHHRDPALTRAMELLNDRLKK